MDNLVKALGGDSGISKSQVSRICAALDEPLTVFRTRPLDHVRSPLQPSGRDVLYGAGQSPARLAGCRGRHRHHRGRQSRGAGP
ncbi:transposase [Streptomyces sp. TRM66268-LWL]|uniref:Transposase n=1 Tax=Streptomyces polyasparticus TaxID=2767826 RepID=A0ABR7SY03_9ACTN|nr:transposase [Streptomyces polyasparticus]